MEIVKSIVRMFRGEVSTKKLIKRGLQVGSNFSRQGNCIIDPPHCWLIKIGDDVTLANGVYILAHDASTNKFMDYTKIGRVTIGDKVFVGAYSIIMPGVTIGNNVVIGCGSVVTKDVPDNVVVCGNPAKVLCTIEEYVEKCKNKMNEENTFSLDYTLRGKIDKSKKQEQVEILKKGIGFTK